MTDQYTNGYEVAKNIFSTFGAVLAPAEMADFAAGFDDYVQEYLGFKDVKEEEEKESLLQNISSLAGRVLLLQFADNLIYEFSKDFNVDALCYWQKEGLPTEYSSTELEWYAQYCYSEIASAYKTVRERWIPDLPELNWDGV